VPEKLQELVALLVKKFETADTKALKVSLVPAARPFFTAEAAGTVASLLRPRRAARAHAVDPLGWYAA